MTTRGLVLVTGGSGFVAGYCIAQLLREGWAVRTTVRSLSREAEVRAGLGQVGRIDARQPGDLNVLGGDLTRAGDDEGCFYLGRVGVHPADDPL